MVCDVFEVRSRQKTGPLVAGGAPVCPAAFARPELYRKHRGAQPARILVPRLGQRAPPTFTLNHINVGTTIENFFNSGGSLPPAFVPLFGLTGSNLTSALDQLHGEAATGAHKVGFQLGDQFLNLMLDPFVDGRSGLRGADHPAFGLAPERESVPPAIALASASVLRASPKALPIYEPRWTVWAPISAVPTWSLPQGLGGGKSDAFQAGVYAASRAGRVSQTRQHDPSDLRTHLCLNHSLNGSCCQLARHGVVRVPALLARKATVEIGWPHNGHCQAKALGRQNPTPLLN